MIRVNLLSDTSGAGGSGAAPLDMGELDAKAVQKKGATNLLLILSIPIGLYLYENQVLIPDLKSQIQSVRNQLNGIREKNEKNKDLVAEITNLKSQQERLRRQLEKIETLRQGRMREVKVLDAIQREVPEKAWLTELDLSQQKIRLKGMAESSSDVNQFNEVLNRSAYLRDVVLEGEFEREYQKLRMREFSFGMRLFEEGGSK